MATRLQHILIDKGVSGKTLAEIANVSEAAISYMIKGQKYLSVEKMKKIADYLGLSIDEMIG